MNDAWTQTVENIKTSIWGTPEPVDHSPLWSSKFSGKIEHPAEYANNVRISAPWTEYLITPGFTTEKFIEQRAAGLARTSTAQCRTTTHHG